MIGLTEQRQQELIKWLEEEIAAYEAARDEIPFGLAEDECNALESYVIALKSLKEINFGEWVTWHGGREAPLGGHVEIKLRDASTDTAYSNEWTWEHAGASDDIVAYRVVEK